MNFARKMVLIPAEQATSKFPVETQKKQKMNPFEKFKKVIQIALKLAIINGYNESGHIRGISGDFLPNTDIIKLLKIAISPISDVAGEEDFVRLLHEANVPLEYIGNEKIKRRLIENKSSAPLYEVKPTIIERQAEYKFEKPIALKRKRVDEEIEESEPVKRKRKIVWEHPDWRKSLESNLSDNEFEVEETE